MSSLNSNLLSEALNDSSTSIIILDEKLKVKLWNSQIALNSHIKQEDALNKGFLDIFPELASSRLHQSIEACVAQGLPAVLSQTLNKQLLPLFITEPGSKKQQPMHQQIHIVPLSTKNDDFFCMLQVFDLTASFKRERYIKTREQEFRALFELAAIGNAVISLKTGEINKVNRKLCELTGYSTEELLQTKLQDLLHPRHRKAFTKLIHTINCQAPQEITKEFELQTKKGNVIWCSVGISCQGLMPVFQKPNALVAIISIQDISEHKNYERQLQQAKLAAESNNRAKSTFLSNMSHELRTPLNAILGFAELLSKDESINEGHRKFLEIINRSGKSLLRLINDVLEISRIETGKLVYQETTFSLLELIDTLEHMFQLKAQHKGLSFEIQMADNIGDWKKGDENHLNEILINLIGNAIKYTEHGNIVLKVSPTTETELLFEVIDTGPGIPDKDKDMVFEAFYQTEQGVSQGEGTGLGLAICREYAALMNSDIKISDSPSGGSNFYFQVSLDPTQALRKKSIAEHQILGLAPDQIPPKILIVEDKPDNQQLIFSLLEKVGFNLQVSNNGAEAIDAFKSWQPDLILMDIKMPVMDGIEATKRIRMLEGGKDVKILAFTASVFQEDHKPVIDAGCDGIINKPVKADLMLNKLQEYLNLDYEYSHDGENEQGETLPDLTRLNKQELEELHEVLLMGETKAIILIVDTVAEKYPKLSIGLKNLALNFQYPLMLKLCEEALAAATD